MRDLDFIVATKAPEEVTEFSSDIRLVESVIAQGPTKSSVRLRSGIQADLRVVSAAEYPFALNYFTGSKEHNIVMRNRALQRGWTLNEYRLAPRRNAKRRIATGERDSRRCGMKRDLYRALDLDYVPPELRENCGEFEAASRQDVCRDLVELENLRGTFHCHTTASDGRSSLEEMAAAAQELGLQYLGIADHSRSSIQAHGLDRARLRATRGRDSASSTKHSTASGFSPALSATSCATARSISMTTPSGELDYVVASVHSVFSYRKRR